MTQKERRLYLIRELLREQPEYSNTQIPANEQEQRNLLRSLFNIRMPQLVSEAFLEVQDAYLQERAKEKGITDSSDLTPAQDGLYLWKGDITTLRCDAIVNAANSQMLGCFCPCHGCIDNAIHTFSGVQLRSACAELMRQQGHEEQTGSAKITPAYNLPCKYVLHTVGPIIRGRVTKKDKDLLPFLFESGRAKRCAKHSVLLYFHRGVSFPQPGSGGNRRGDSTKIQKRIWKSDQGDIQCFQGNRLQHLPGTIGRG